MANSVDHDQTASGAVWSGSALFAYVILSAALMDEILEHFPYSKKKEVAPFGSKFFPFRVDTFSEGLKNYFDRIGSHWKCIHSP